SRSVHGAHIRKTTLYRTHCSSSHEFEDVSKSFRTVAFVADTRTAIRISHDRYCPTARLKASMTRVRGSSDWISELKLRTCLPQHGRCDRPASPPRRELSSAPACLRLARCPGAPSIGSYAETCSRWRRRVA